MKKSIFLLSFLLYNLSIVAQIHLEGYRQSDINPELLKGYWHSQWISIFNEPTNTYGIYHMRKTFELTEVPDKFIVHVTADNRYKLYINGTFVSLGPARGDMYNWNFETVDLAPHLQKGKNVLAAVVWNMAEYKPVAQISFNHTGFLMQGNTEKESIVNTNGSWVGIKNEAYQPWSHPVCGYYAVGAGEKIDSDRYPWGWEQPDYDDSQWKPVACGKYGAIKGAMDYTEHLLVPSPIPPMEYKQERFKSVRQAEGIKTPSGFPVQKTAVIVPAHSKVSLLLDNNQLTTGYLSLLFSKGKAAEIRIGYAESLYKNGQIVNVMAKGNRKEIENKLFLGYEDKVIADGGLGRKFTPLWWRTWRYVNLTIQTAEEPLIIDDIYGTFSAYPFKNETEFSAPGHEILNRILTTGWHTARLCANETYMDCPYYEQLQYFGDTRIQAMISMYNTHDPYMVKNAIEQGRQSMTSEGITMSRYPSSQHQFISSYSLSWIDMGYDYWMYRGDEAYLKKVLPCFRSILAWFEQWLKPDYSLDYIPHWFFADWAKGFNYGEPIREKEGNSAYQDLLFIITLEHAAKMEKAFGLPAMGKHYSKLASHIRQTIRRKYWVESRGLFADTYDHHSFSQHVNALAILAGIVKGDEATEVMQQTLQDSTLTQATIYFRYYLHQAMKVAGLGDLLLDNLQIWEDQLALGLTTWAETPEPSRSDCHAWGASLNIEFFRILLGIDTDAPAFRKIHIAPSLGKLKEVKGTIPHPSGFISAAYKVDKDGRLKATLTLPDNTTGVFVWKGKKYPLKAGQQSLKIR